MKRLALTFALVTFVACAPLLRTNIMLKDYVGKPIDTFMQERAFAADVITPLSGGGAIYAFSGGPGGPRCRFYVVTDAKRIITSYRFENC
jgi:hypothetical protein